MIQELRDWYETPLYYDIIFGAGTACEADFLEWLHHHHGLGNKPGRVLEPACGSGRLISEMARRGWRAFGFDGSAAMLAYAGTQLDAEGLRAVLWQDWMQSFELPKRAPQFELAHCLVSTFKYILSEVDAAACLRRVAAALKPGGVFALGIHLTDYDAAKPEHERWIGERDGIRVVANTRTWPADRAARLENLRTRLKIEAGGRTRVQETRWQFRTYNAAQIRRLLRKVPQLALVACYDFTYDPAAPRALDDSYSDVLMVLRRV